MRLPRVDCPKCGRSIAARPLADRIGVGRLARHDDPAERALWIPARVSCSGSLVDVALDTPATQLALDAPEPDSPGREQPQLPLPGDRPMPDGP